MSRPAQLEQQIARVKELQAEMLEGDKPETQETPTANEPTEPVTPPVVNEPPATVSKEDYDKLEQRYRTLQGMHSADTHRFRNELASAQEAIQNLEDRIAASEAATKVTTNAPAKYVTEDDEKEYGEVLEMVRRASREEAEAIAAKREETLLERINQLESQLGHVRNTVVPTVENMTRTEQDRARAGFWSELETKVPDWKAINDDPNFKAWLLAEDPITGANRQQFLRQAQQNLNAGRVVRFFEEWKRTKAGGPTPAPNKTQSELENLVAPGASKGGGAPTQQEKKKWTREEVAQFYKDVTIGKYANKPDERKRIQDDIFKAQAEGRLS